MAQPNGGFPKVISNCITGEVGNKVPRLDSLVRSAPEDADNLNVVLPSMANIKASLPDLAKQVLLKTIKTELDTEILGLEESIKVANENRDKVTEGLGNVGKRITCMKKKKNIACLIRKLSEKDPANCAKRTSISFELAKKNIKASGQDINKVIAENFPGYSKGMLPPKSMTVTPSSSKSAEHGHKKMIVSRDGNEEVDEEDKEIIDFNYDATEGHPPGVEMEVEVETEINNKVVGVLEAIGDANHSPAAVKIIAADSSIPNPEPEGNPEVDGNPFQDLICTDESDITTPENESGMNLDGDMHDEETSPLESEANKSLLYSIIE